MLSQRGSFSLAVVATVKESSSTSIVDGGYPGNQLHNLSHVLGDYAYRGRERSPLSRRMSLGSQNPIVQAK
ncbi:hypothetical protein L226DRAFT_536122 [Lentinus tigrinus ALCF2SS1-7]|uniref:uncharacterized protein n=1 Tax=Lentinus tigrinus ALCF2SS1-7 TaxID=1328758 RepID=UPI001165EF3E|nr:hypothetical protein L226DRAFT_536122 [Lentinus tigrinus ALCF2SS1-7]